MQTHPQEAANKQEKTTNSHGTIASWLSKNSHLEVLGPFCKVLCQVSNDRIHDPASNRAPDYKTYVTTSPQVMVAFYLPIVDGKC